MGASLRILAALVVASSLLLSSARTSGAQAPERSATRAQTLIMGFQGDITIPFVANPFLPATNLAVGLHQLIYESLFYLNYETGKLEPWLATGFRYNHNSTSVTIFLRQGARWSDGVPFTAQDVLFTIRMLKSHSSLLGSTGMQEVKAMTAPNSHTVVLTFKQTDSRFILNNFSVHIYSSTVIVPQHIWKNKNPSTFTDFNPAKGWPVGTGPYRLASVNSSRLIYDRNDNWWAAKTHFHALPAPRRVIFRTQGTEDTRAALLDSNQMDVSDVLNLDSYRVVQRKNSKIIGWSASHPTFLDPCPHYLAVNTMEKPWNNPEMRWALSYSIDKSKFAFLEDQGAGAAAKFLFPAYGPLNAYLNANADLFRKYPTTRYNPALAQKIFEQHGYHKGGNGMYADANGPLTLNIVMMNAADGGNGWAVAMQLFQQYFSSIGINVVPKVTSYPPYQDALDLGNFDAGMHWSCGSVSDPYATLQLFNQSLVMPVGQRTNGYEGRWKNAQFTKIVNQMGRLTPGNRKLKPLFREALAIWLKNLPAIPLAQEGWVVPYNTTYWTNWPTAANHYIQPASWWMSFHQIVIRIKPAHR